MWENCNIDWKSSNPLIKQVLFLRYGCHLVTSDPPGLRLQF